MRSETKLRAQWDGLAIIVAHSLPTTNSHRSSRPWPRSVRQPNRQCVGMTHLPTLHTAWLDESLLLC